MPTAPQPEPRPETDASPALDPSALPGRRYGGWYLGCCVLLAAAVAGLNWGVDPLQFYRRASFYDPVFSTNQRYQKPGLAKHYPYEIVVVGDSHAENFSPAYLEERLDAPALNLAISGSTAREQRLILEKAITTGKVRRVIWVLGRVPFRKPPDMVVADRGPFPFHLYDEGPQTYSRYLLSTDSLELSLAALLGWGHTDLETLDAWGGEYEFSQQRMLLDYRNRVEALKRLRAKQEYVPRDAFIAANVEEHLRPLAAAHPEIHFDLVFPPYSIVSYLVDDRMAPWMFDERLRYKARVVEAVAALPNVAVYDLQVVRAITHDLDNYKDLEHFHPRWNTYIVDAIAIGRHRVDKDRFDRVLELFASQVRGFRKQVCDASDVRRYLCPTATFPGDA